MKALAGPAFALVLAMATAGCVAAPQPQALAMPKSRTVIASFYGAGEALPSAFTASGERFRPLGLTAAHRTLPLGTRVRVCARRCAVVVINDRGPAAWTGRALDLSLGSARAVGLDGVGPVTLEVLD